MFLTFILCFVGKNFGCFFFASFFFYNISSQISLRAQLKWILRVRQRIVVALETREEPLPRGHSLMTNDELKTYQLQMALKALGDKSYNDDRSHNTLFKRLDTRQQQSDYEHRDDAEMERDNQQEAKATLANGGEVCSDGIRTWYCNNQQCQTARQNKNKGRCVVCKAHEKNSSCSSSSSFSSPSSSSPLLSPTDFCFSG